MQEAAGSKAGRTGSREEETEEDVTERTFSRWRELCELKGCKTNTVTVGRVSNIS